MLSNTQLTLIRAVATAIITALAAIQPLYPSYTWITAVIAACAAVGIHVIPAISQKGTVMSEQTPEVPALDGLAAMGLKPPAMAATAPEVHSPAPEVPSPETASPVQTGNPAVQVLRDAANALLKIAETL